MRLNDISPSLFSKQAPKRLGRGIGSGLGKTSGRGHKGQTSRAGGTIKPGFEGGQMPIQRRLPKFGFKSKKSFTRDEIRLGELQNVAESQVNLLTLKKCGLIGQHISQVKIILSGSVDKAYHIESGIQVTQGAKRAIEAAGGTVA